jgi:DNA repair photolyase
MSIPLRLLNDAPALVQDLEGFVPRVVDQPYLRGLGIDFEPAPRTLAGLRQGSEALALRLAQGTLVPRSRITPAEIDLGSELEIHNYTGRCPTLTYEISPVQGCHVGCQYCLVTDGAHEQELVLYTNYAALVERVLEEKHSEPHFFYFSAKTEALQEPTLQTGVAHEILRAFIRHYERHPRSLARLFFASKGGLRQLEQRHDGESVLDLFARIAPRMQFNTSVSIMPEPLRRVLEPFAPPLEERLDAVRACQERGVISNSALVQPILTPCLEPARLDAFFGELAAVNIVNFKPELLTVAPANLAIIAQIAGHFDPALERRLYEAYLHPDNLDHKKQRDRTAPSRELSRAAIATLLEAGGRHGLSASICYWVRVALGIDEATIPTINGRGFQCLGYQTRLFEQPGEQA